MLSAGQVPRVRVEATLLPVGGGAIPLPVSSARRRSSAGYVHRHELTLVVPDLPDRPRLDLGAGHMVMVSTSIRAGREWVDAPQGVYRITDAPRDSAGTWSLTGKSEEYVAQRADLLCDVKAEGSALEFLATMIQGACPDARLLADVSDVPLAATKCESGQSGSRWSAIESVAAACGWSVWCDLRGVWRVGPRRRVEGSPDWSVRKGASAVSWGSARSDAETYNVVVVRDRGRRFWGIAVDDRPGSPTYVGADVVQWSRSARTRGLNAMPRTYGLYAHVVEMDGIGSDAQAEAAAQDALAGSASVRRSLEVVSSWQPWADVDDLLLIDTEAPAVLAVLDGVDVDLTGDSSMRLEVRS